ncbi:MAG: pantothenate kinase [Cyanobacteria bacterium P01_H01_bin.153]
MPDVSPKDPLEARWLGLIIGNTRLHWALFWGDTLEGTWHTPHLTAEIVDRLIALQFAARAWPVLGAMPAPLSVPPALGKVAASTPVPLYCASVVPAQTVLWQNYPGLRVVTLNDVPLADCYPTLGIDRALNLLGAGDRQGWPVLVIDAGTALTFTAGVKGQFVGGAILPGLQAQFAALTAKTATLPPIEAELALPPQWASNTSAAMRSGVIYGALATMRDFISTWQQQHPQSKAVLTGGNSAQLYQWWNQLGEAAPVVLEPNLTFWGLRKLRR